MSRLLKRSALMVLALSLAGSLYTRDTGAQATSCLVGTTLGAVQGVDMGPSCAFFGVPYATPPMGALRWKPTQPAAPWTTVFQANTPPSNCPSLNAANVPGGNEDCLRLNVWVQNPAPATPAPVIVWLHTGSFVAASANFASHNGKRLAEETGVIVVAPNYRLGPLGFLVNSSLAAEDPGRPVSGNYGLLDQRAALAWVRDNIASFGGDPNNVTLAGTSAGADSVGLHLVSPGSAGLFHRAIIESGTPTIKWPTHAESLAQGDAFAAALGCLDPDLVASCLRGKTRNEVLLALSLGSQQVLETPTRAFWLPVVDDAEIPEQPRLTFQSGLFQRVPILIGFNRDEGAGNFINRSFPSGVSLAQYLAWIDSEFGPDAPAVLSTYPASSFALPVDAMAQVVGDGQFICETQRMARLISESHERIFVYSYEYEIDDLFPDRVIHGVESNIIFGNNYAAPQFASHALNAADLALHAAMAGYWVRFATTGDPNLDDEAVVHWPAFKDPIGQGRGSNKYILFDSLIRSDKRQQEAQCGVWEPYFFRTMLGKAPAGG
jgi:para-nitrobenzyl esterase